MFVIGQEYLDFVAGISTCVLGHADPDLAQAVGGQMRKFHHVSNLYYIPEQVCVRLCTRALVLTPFSQRFIDMIG